MIYENNNDYELIYLIKEDNEEALSCLFKKYEPLIKKIANSYYKKFKDAKIEYEDLHQEGRIGLYNALKRYKEQKEVLFYTFALLCIERSIISYLKRNTSLKQFPIINSNSYDEKIVNTLTMDDEPLLLLEQYDVTKKIIDFKNELSFLDASIFELRYSSFSYSDIANLLDINEKQVDNKLFKIKNKLKKYLFENS